MKYTISDENRWTTLSAVVDNQLFGVYPPNFFFDGGSTYESCLDVEPTTFNVSGEYPHVRVFVDLSQARIMMNHDHKPKNLNPQELRDFFIEQLKGVRRTYFGDTKKQEQELYFRLRRGLADMYEDGYNDGKNQHKRDYDAVQGKFDWILESVMDYMRAVINNKK